MDGAEHAVAGHIIALVATGYEKTRDFQMNNGTLTLYQNKADGKVHVLITFADKPDYIALYPQGGFWNDKFHRLNMGPGTGWTERTTAEVAAAVALGIDPFAAKETDNGDA